MSCLYSLSHSEAVPYFFVAVDPLTVEFTSSMLKSDQFYCAFRVKLAARRAKLHRVNLRGTCLPVASDAQKLLASFGYRERESKGCRKEEVGVRSRQPCDFRNDITRLEPSITE